jgi:16S rRNA (uracil1498-N3)-methyltransferase
MARAAAVAQVLVADPGDPVVDPDDRHHLARVLRLRPGEPVIATDGRGSWSSCRYRGDGDRALEPDGPTMFEPPLRPALAVAFAPAKGDRPEWVVQKLTELGIDRIVPLATARSVVRWDRDRDRDRADRAVARLGRVAREAAGQSRRVWLPEVTGVRTLATLADDLTRPADRGSGGPAGGEGLALAQLGGDRPTAATTVVAVGPEGGWAPEELAIGTATVGLGPSVLRAETAALAAGAILAGLRAGTVGVEDA